MKKLGILVCALGAASSQALVIDNFLSGTYGGNFISSGSDLAWTAATVPGGIRATDIVIQSNTGAGAGRIRTNSGFGILSVSTEPGVRATSAVKYGFASGSSTASSNPLNLNLSSAPLFNIDFRANDLPLMVKVTLNTNGTAGSFSRSLPLPGGMSTPSTQTFDFSSDASMLGDVDSIIVDFDATVDGDFTITNINAVPEPTTMAGLAISMVALARKRRKKTA